MKWLLLILFGSITMIALVLGGGFAWIMNIKTDVSDPNFAAKFQKTMKDLCFREAKGEIRGAGATLDYQQEALVKQVCSCQTKAATKILAKKGAKTPVQLQQAYNDSGPEMNAAFKSCAEAHGLQ